MGFIKEVWGDPVCRTLIEVIGACSLMTVWIVGWL